MASHNRRHPITDELHECMDYLITFCEWNGEMETPHVIEHSDSGKYYNWESLSNGLKKIKDKGSYNDLERCTLRDLREHFYPELKEKYEVLQYNKKHQTYGRYLNSISSGIY